jgi:hypothetical protein
LKHFISVLTGETELKQRRLGRPWDSSQPLDAAGK